MAKRQRADDEAGIRRKLIAFDPETWHALDLYARDSMQTIQELADQAFADLLRKHHRPLTLKDALRHSARLQPANDPSANAAPHPSKPRRNRRSRRPRGS